MMLLLLFILHVRVVTSTKVLFDILDLKTVAIVPLKTVVKKKHKALKSNSMIAVFFCTFDLTIVHFFSRYHTY